MDRRELIKMIALLTGGAMVGGEVFLSGCKSAGKADAGFTASNIALLDEVGETIIPATNTPGAKATQVGEYMKVFVTDCYTQAEQEAFMKGIGQLDEACEKMHGHSFMKATPQQRLELLTSLEKDAKEFDKAVDDKDRPLKEKLKSEGKSYDFVGSPKHYYTMMKQLTLAGFFSSKPGMTQALRHVPVPGRYDGAYPYKKGDKAWAE